VSEKPDDLQILSRESTAVVCHFHKSNPLSFHAIQDLNNGVEDAPYSNYNSSLSWAHLRDPGLSLSDVQKHLPLLTESKLREWPDEYLIFFWASSASFTIELLDPSTLPAPSPGSRKKPRDWRKEASPVIKDAHGKIVGKAERMHKEHWATKENSGENEFIVVAVRPGIPELAELGAEYRPRVVAMQIRRDKETGVAYRVHIAEIDQDAWLDAKPTLKLIALA
jgi:hypothetical protein